MDWCGFQGGKAGVWSVGERIGNIPVVFGSIAVFLVFHGLFFNGNDGLGSFMLRVASRNRLRLAPNLSIYQCPIFTT